MSHVLTSCQRHALPHLLSGCLRGSRFVILNRLAHIKCAATPPRRHYSRLLHADRPSDSRHHLHRPGGGLAAPHSNMGQPARQHSRSLVNNPIRATDLVHLSPQRREELERHDHAHTGTRLLPLRLQFVAASRMGGLEYVARLLRIWRPSGCFTWNGDIVLHCQQEQ